MVYLSLIKNVSSVTSDHVKTLQNLITQVRHDTSYFCNSIDFFFNDVYFFVQARDHLLGGSTVLTHKPYLQLQTNIEIVTYLEANLKVRKIISPPSFMAHLLCEGFRKSMYTDSEAQAFLESNPCILPMLTTIKVSPCILPIYLKTFKFMPFFTLSKFKKYLLDTCII